MEYKIIMALVAVLFGSWTLFGYLVLRLITGIDEKFKKLFDITEDLPAIREAIEWLKIGKKEK
jgi:hypothetical protein